MMTIIFKIQFQFLTCHIIILVLCDIALNPSRESNSALVPNRVYSLTSSKAFFHSSGVKLVTIRIVILIIRNVAIVIPPHIYKSFATTMKTSLKYILLTRYRKRLMRTVSQRRASLFPCCT